MGRDKAKWRNECRIRNDERKNRVKFLSALVAVRSVRPNNSEPILIETKREKKEKTKTKFTELLSFENSHRVHIIRYVR